MSEMEQFPLAVCALHEWHDGEGDIRCVRCGATVPPNYFMGVRDMDEVDEDNDYDEDAMTLDEYWDDEDEYGDADYPDEWDDPNAWDEVDEFDDVSDDEWDDL